MIFCFLSAFLKMLFKLVDGSKNQSQIPFDWFCDSLVHCLALATWGQCSLRVLPAQRHLFFSFQFWNPADEGSRG